MYGYNYDTCELNARNSSTSDSSSCASMSRAARAPERKDWSSRATASRARAASTTGVDVFGGGVFGGVNGVVNGGVVATSVGMGLATSLARAPSRALGKMLNRFGTRHSMAKASMARASSGVRAPAHVDASSTSASKDVGSTSVALFSLDGIHDETLVRRHRPVPLHHDHLHVLSG